jgi:hypothetical protein
MWRNETKADIQAREARLLKKQQEEWNRNHAPKVPQKTLQEILHPNRASEEYQRKLELRAAEERFREREAQQEEARKAELEKQLKLAEKSETSITASKLYENGLEARSSDQGIEAATLFWQALICGESRAAYPLFEMLWNGESGVGKNHEMAAVILHVGKEFINQDCVATKGIKNPNNSASSKIYVAALDPKNIINLTDDIINAQESIISALMDQCILKTRQYEEPMTSVFAHPDVEEVQVEVSGDNDSSSNKCVLM